MKMIYCHLEKQRVLIIQNFFWVLTQLLIMLHAHHFVLGVGDDGYGVRKLARDCLVRTRCSLAPPPSFRPRASRRPPRRGARICCYPAPRCWRACRRTQKHAARQQRLRATPASTEAVAMVGVGALRSRGRSRPNLLAPAAAPDGGRQARAAYR